jgi:hypothetical protein
MDTPYSTPDHLHDAGVLTASELIAFSRAGALFVLDYARIIVERFFDEFGVPDRSRPPELVAARSTPWLKVVHAASKANAPEA